MRRGVLPWNGSLACSCFCSRSFSGLRSGMESGWCCAACFQRVRTDHALRAVSRSTRVTRHVAIADGVRFLATHFKVLRYVGKRSRERSHEISSIRRPCSEDSTSWINSRNNYLSSVGVDVRAIKLPLWEERHRNQDYRLSSRRLSRLRLLHRPLLHQPLLHRPLLHPLFLHRRLWRQHPFGR